MRNLSVLWNRIRRATWLRQAFWQTSSLSFIAACASSPPVVEPVGRGDVALEADVCALTRAYSEVLGGKSSDQPPMVVLARAGEWFELATAYDLAKADLERCIDPKLGATFLTESEVWPGRPPIRATKKFDYNSFQEDRASAIVLETINTASGAELRLRVL